MSENTFAPIATLPSSTIWPSITVSIPISRSLAISLIILFSASITSVPGASSVFVGANVTYANDAKEALGVKQETLDKYGAVSQETAKEMAISVGDYHKTDVSVSFTGNAGPDAMEGKPVGEVYIGIKIKDNIKVYKLQLDGDRQKIREQCVNFAIKKLYDEVKVL